MFCMDTNGLFPSTKGTYVLVMALSKSVSVTYSRRDHVLKMKKGWCYYVGSAFNSGGFQARVGRHILLDKKKRWHIDYLRPLVQMKEVWLLPDVAVECEISNHFKKMSGSPAQFGASDCHCESHLFYSRLKVRFSDFKAVCGHMARLKRIVVDV